MHAPALSYDADAGGYPVWLFSDLKRHDMGDGLAETFALATEQRNREFTTARLWGIADTGPYLHDGRATTLSEAILLHGGEAEPVRNEFAALADLENVGVTGRDGEGLVLYTRAIDTDSTLLDHAK